MRIFVTFCFVYLISAYSIPPKQLNQVERPDNPVFVSPPKKLPKGQLYFSVEIPSGSANKYETRTATGQLILDRVLCPRKVAKATSTVSKFPANYGFSAGRFNIDYDPIDLLVLGGDRKYTKMVANNNIQPTAVRIIGIVKMEECDSVPCQEEGWEQDWKVLATDLSAQRYRDIKDAKQLPKQEQDAIAMFFSNYKGLKRGHPQTRVAGFASKKAAMSFVKSFSKVDRAAYRKLRTDCQLEYQKVAKNLAKLTANAKPNPNKKFLSCIQRIWPRELLQQPKALDKYLSYSAYQILRLKLEQNDINLQAAIPRMAQLRAAKKSHYRFVGFDRSDHRQTTAGRGTGSPIFEWVKTKNRNAGCPKGFPPQHYETVPLIDLADSQS